MEYPVDTRISDRIKHRSIPSSDVCDILRSKKIPPSEPLWCDLNTCPQKTPPSQPIRCDANTCPQKTPPSKTTLTQRHSGVYNTKDNTDRPTDMHEIPSKPAISIRQSKDTAHSSHRRLAGGTTLNKVLHYDYENKFVTQQVRRDTNVEKIDDNAIQVIFNSESEAELKKAANKWDRDSEIRGRQALKREKIHRDYSELLQRLPVLQKQERILNIFSDKPEHHMSDDRLKEREEKRQACLENAYERLFPPPAPTKPVFVTIPPKNKASREPLKTVNAMESPNTLNVAMWDVNNRKTGKAIFTSTQSNAADDGSQQYIGVSENTRYLELKSLLESLKAQKQTLAQEIKSMNSSSLNELLKQYDSVNKSATITTIDPDKQSKIAPSNEDETAKPDDTKTTGEKKSRLKEKLKKFHPESSSSSNSLSPSPKKKAKTKGKRQLIILQNTSTQTTPKRVEENQETAASSNDKSTPALQVNSQNNVQNNLTVKDVCVCRSHEVKDDKLCEIVIKIHESESQAEVHVNPAKKSNQRAIEASESESKLQTQPKEDPKQSCKSQVKPHISLKAKRGKESITVQRKDPVLKKTKQTTWQAQLSQNLTSSGSTSYYSPPEDMKNRKSRCTLSEFRNFQKQLQEALTKPSQESNVSKGSDYGRNLNAPNKKEATSFVVKYIEKLLAMSENSVDELEISTVSDVSTPSQSVVEVPSNHPVARLGSFMKSFDISFADLQRYFSNKEEIGQAHYNTLIGSLSETLRNGSQVSSRTDSTSQTSDPKDVSKCQSATDVREMSLEDYSKKYYPKTMSEYAEIAKSCNERITGLTAMIEKVRLEKKKMMQSRNSSESDKENSTSYMDMPKDSKKNGTRSPTESAREQEELNRELLDIDFSLAERLKALTSSEIRAQHQPLLIGKEVYTAPKKNNEHIELNLELPTPTTATSEALPGELEKGQDNSNAGFIPLLVDIPKLPKLSTPECLLFEPKSKKPPTSKGLTIAKKFNGDITAVPHELSTIAEADTHTSSKIQKLSSVDAAALETEQLNVSLKTDVAKKSSEEGVPDILSELVKNATVYRESITKSSVRNAKRILTQRSSEKKQSSDSSSDKSNDIETVEAMLQEIGMGWAVTTLRKTQEALALTSSSSSLDISIKQKEVRVTDSGSTSELSLKEVLGKHFLAKLTSSMTNSSDSSLSSLMKEFQDISAIQGSSGTNNDKTNRRTSTPVQTSKDK